MIESSVLGVYPSTESILAMAEPSVQGMYPNNGKVKFLGVYPSNGKVEYPVGVS